jgi:ArsR family transcriptional regulator
VQAHRLRELWEGVMTELKTITKEELLQKIEKGENVQIVNVLQPEGYHMGFIKGSKRIPYTELEQRAGELDKSREVVTYCANSMCSASKTGAEILSKLGYNVRAYEGGIREWTDAGLPKE